MKFKVECRFTGTTWMESMNSGLFGTTFATEALAQSAIERCGSSPRSNYRIVPVVADNLPSPPTAPIIQRALLLKAHDRHTPKEKTVSKKKTKTFDDFPVTLYITHHEGYGEDSPGYFLAFADEVEAAEDAQENDSELATYTFDSQGHAQVKKEVTYD